jgi:hypothetical protein
MPKKKIEIVRLKSYDGEVIKGELLSISQGLMYESEISLKINKEIKIFTTATHYFI